MLCKLISSCTALIFFDYFHTFLLAQYFLLLLISLHLKVAILAFFAKVCYTVFVRGTGLIASDICKNLI